MESRNRAASRWAGIFAVASLVPLLLVLAFIVHPEPMTGVAIIFVTAGIAGFLGSWYGASRDDRAKSLH